MATCSTQPSQPADIATEPPSNHSPRPWIGPPGKDTATLPSSRQPPEVDQPPIPPAQRRAHRLRHHDPGGAPAPNRSKSRTLEGLTEREQTVLDYLPTMLKASEIAADLNVSVNTVKAHLRSLYRKLEAGTRREAVEKARARGLL